jgi:hypothetical protein
MKSFKDFLNEEMMPYAQTEKGFVGVDNGPVRDNINIHLAAITAKPYATPYHAIEMVRKVLAPFHIFIPAMNFLDGDSGHEVFEINQFGDKMGMTNDGKVVVKNSDNYFVYFEYQMNDKGSFDIFCEVIGPDELDEIMADIEAELEEGDDDYYDEMQDAEDSFDSYKEKNQVNEATLGGAKYKRKNNPNNTKSKKSSKYINDVMDRAYGKVADAKGHERKRLLQKGHAAFKVGMANKK